MPKIDNKHSIFVDAFGNPQVAKRLADGSLVAISDKEPIILFRGRDKLALPMLQFYRQLCKNDGCTDFQLESMDDMIRRFQEFADQSPTMKQPGSTKGL
jgi:hypothetical protein